MEHKIRPEHPAAPALRARPNAYVRLKAAVEWSSALLLLIAAAPLMVLVSAAVALTSKGPVFYSQMRLGLHGRPFRLYKFRTMKHRCEAVTGPVWSISNDPRATSIGRFLRDTHIDELPQLWNVLRGEMGLIGPRPERPEIVEKIERVLPEFRERLCVRPGLSGLAQVLIPPDADIQTVQSKLAHDLEYIRSLGPALDLRIVLSTVLCLLQAKPRVAGWLVRDYASFPTFKLPVAEELPPMTAADSTLAKIGPITTEKPLAA